MKESTKVPSPVVREIAKRRLASNKLSKKPPMALPCLSTENVINIPGLCGKKAPPPRVYRQAKYQQNWKDLILPDIRGIKNPFKDIPTRDRFFCLENITRKPKQSNFDIGNLKTVKDNIHHAYFSIVDGRPIRSNHDVKLYMKNLRDMFLLRADAAYLNDQSLKIETLYSTYEKEEYDKIVRLFIKTVSNFQKCLNDSFKIAHYAIMKQQEVEEKVRVKQAELEQYTFEYTRLRGLVLPMIDKFELLLKYKSFLDQCPPIWWRIQNNVGFFGPSTVFKTFFLDSDENVSLTSKIDEYQFKEFETDEVVYDNPKVIMVKDTTCLLYFKEPVEIMNLFDDMAYYSYRYIQAGKHNSKVLNSILKCRNYLSSQLSIEIQITEFEIKMFGDHIEYLEEKAEYAKTKFFKILGKEFKYTVSSYDYLKLFVCVQYVNTEILGTVADPKDTLYLLMRQLEGKYEHYMLALDGLDYEIVKNIISQCMQEDREMMKRAYDAQRALHEWAVFEKALRASFDPPRYKFKKSL